ncbi:MAG: hypothetical protein KDM91_08535, partial [Verrucomicrobiae bacterium]|nr:hypothetical protein [Verrucomicrobiae bacterium]
MKRDEETIEKWKTLASKRRVYRVGPETQQGSVEDDAQEEPVAEKPAAEDAEIEAVEPAVEDETVADAALEAGGDEAGEEETVSETVAESAPAPDEPEPDAAESSEAIEDASSEGEAEPDSGESDDASESEEAAEPVPAAADSGETIESEEALERHFRENFANEALETVDRAVVPGDIPGRSLSRPLLDLVKLETERQKRGFPLGLIQSLCREFEKSGLRFFKRGKKALHVSVVRPRGIEDESALTDRIRRIVEYIREHPRVRVVSLLDALIPGTGEERKSRESFQEHHLTPDEHDLLADLRWLTSEGYVIEFPNSELLLGRSGEGARHPESAGATGRKKSPKTKKPRKEPAPAAEPVAAEPEELLAVEEAETSPTSAVAEAEAEPEEKEAGSAIADPSPNEEEEGAAESGPPSSSGEEE